VGESFAREVSTTASRAFFRASSAGKIQAMRRDPLERLSIRAALGLGFGLVLGLWIFTGYVLTARIAEIEARTAEITARYLRAQDVLSAVRQQINSSAIVLRDALLDPGEEARARYRDRLEQSFAGIVGQLDGYQPVAPGVPEQQIARLRSEVEALRGVTLAVLSAATADPAAQPFEMLAGRTSPRRAAAIALSDEVRTVNRRALVEHQMATAAIHRAAEQQWWYGLGAALAATLAIAFVAIVYAGRLEDRLRRGREKDARYARDLQRLSSRLVEAQEEERRSIARELHDEVGQVLSAVAVEMQVAERVLHKPDEALRALGEAQQLADGAIRAVRDLSLLLRPTMLDDLGLGAAIDWLLRGLARRHDMQVELVQTGLAGRLPASIEVAAFRIAQEGLTNVARHAKAGWCVVRLESDGMTLRLSVEDDGIGLDASASARPDRRRGLGLVGIRERVADFEGRFSVSSRPPQGTCLRVQLPLARAWARDSAAPETATPGLLDQAKVVHG
jgi:signal transduction histidine kinase